MGLDALKIDRASYSNDDTIRNDSKRCWSEFSDLNKIDIFEILFFRGTALVLAMLVVVNIFIGSGYLRRYEMLASLVFLAPCFSLVHKLSMFLLFRIPLLQIQHLRSPWPLFITAFLAFIILKEKVSKATCFAMILAGLGIGVIIAGDVSADGKLGILLLLTACCFSCFAVTLRQNKHIEMLPVLLLTGSFSMLIGLFGKWNMIPSLHDITLCFVWGGLLQGVGQSLLVLSTRVLRAAEIPLIMLLEFTLGPIWVWVLFGEQITFMAAVGGTLIFGYLRSSS